MRAGRALVWGVCVCVDGRCCPPRCLAHRALQEDAGGAGRLLVIRRLCQVRWVGGARGPTQADARGQEAATFKGWLTGQTSAMRPLRARQLPRTAERLNAQQALEVQLMLGKLERRLRRMNGSRGGGGLLWRRRECVEEPL